MRLPDGPVRVVGRGSHSAWTYPGLCEQTISVDGGVKVFSPADQFITVGAGMLVSELREVLAAQGQMIPFLESFLGNTSSSPREGEVTPDLPSPWGGGGFEGASATEKTGAGTHAIGLGGEGVLNSSPREGEVATRPAATEGVSSFEANTPPPSSHSPGLIRIHLLPKEEDLHLQSPSPGEGVARYEPGAGIVSSPELGSVHPPYPNPESGTIGGLLSMALPHPAEAQFFDWRSWVLGTTILRADGTIVKSGSTVVKSVAGFDVFKLLVGARGTLGVILDVTLRTMGHKELTWPVHRGPQTECTWIQRVLPANLGEMVEKHHDKLVAWDEGTATLWASEPLPRIDGDWAMITHPDKSDRFRANEPEFWIRRLKAELDPENKLNPGGLGDLL